MEKFCLRLVLMAEEYSGIVIVFSNDYCAIIFRRIFGRSKSSSARSAPISNSTACSQRILGVLPAQAGKIRLGSLNIGGRHCDLSLLLKLHIIVRKVEVDKKWEVEKKSCQVVIDGVTLENRQKRANNK
jgi:hypothetical protein